MRAARVRYHSDDRRAFWGDIFDTVGGDFNAVCLKPHIPIAWHRHWKQDDQLFLLSGRLRVQWFHEQLLEITPPINRIDWELNENNRGPLFLPRDYWHGYEALEPNTVILQFNGPGKWDGTDEERHPIDDEMPWNIP